jgi:hypothetical protein
VNREAVMLALANQLIRAPAVFTFTANLTEGSAELSDLSGATGLFQGMPLIGSGVPDFATLASVSPPTMSAPATSNQTGALITQGFVTLPLNEDGSRARMEHWGDVDAQPAMFLDDGDEEHPDRLTTMPAKFTLEAEVWLYYDAGETSGINPMPVMNALMGAIEAALAPSPPGSAQTLGNAVVHAQIAGKVIKDSGHLSGQAVAMMPVKMLVQQQF